MGAENSVNITNVTMALNNSEVRKALKENGVEVTKESIFKVQDDAILIDVEGDGVFDKSLKGLFKKNGDVNTNHKKYDVDDLDVNSSYIKEQNEFLKGMNNTISKYKLQSSDLDKQKQTVLDKKFDEETNKANLLKEKNDLLNKLELAKIDVSNILKDYNDNNNHWTKKQYKAYQKKLIAAQNKVDKLEVSYNNFDVDARLKLLKAEFEQDKKNQTNAIDVQKQELGKLIEKEMKNLRKAKLSYNDYLNKHGYDTIDERKNVKDLEYNENISTEKGTRLGDAETTEATALKLAEAKFKEQYPDIEDFELKYNAKTGEISVLLNDGDSVSDYTITGFFDPDKQTLDFDAKLGLKENKNSTRQLKLASDTLYNLDKQIDQLDAAVDKDKIDAIQAKIETYKETLEKEHGITIQDVLDYRARSKTE